MPTTTKPPALPRTLHLGDTGPDVEADKRALVKWNNGRRGAVIISQSFGPAFENLVKQFQQIEGETIDGIIGPQTYSKMVGLQLFDAYGDELLQDETILLEPRNLFLSIADLTVSKGDLFGYSEEIGEAPGARDWFRVAPINTTGSNWATVVKKSGKLTSDCSGHYYGCAGHAGIKIPNPDGATGALLELDHIDLDQAQPGDGVIFVGPSEPAGAHIMILRAKLPGGDWRGVNNGGPTGAPPIYSTLSAQAEWQTAHGAPMQVVVRLPA